MSQELNFVLEQAEQQWLKARQIDRWMKGYFAEPYVPSHTGSEYSVLAKRSVANLLPLVVDVVSQSLFVEGYRTSSGERGPAWSMWSRERMGARQSPVHRAAFTFGAAFVQVLPDKHGQWRIRGLSPMSSFALWDDPVQDEWPQVVVRRQQVPRSEDELVYWVDDTSYQVWRGKNGAYRQLSSVEHGLGVCPVVRFADHVGLDGETPSQIEVLVPGQERLNQTVFDLLMTQTFSSFKVKTLTGVLPPEENPQPGDPDYDPDKHGDEETLRKMERYKLKIAQDRILVASDPEAKFGELSETNLAGFISAVELAIRQIATMSQTPPHALMGSISNLSAEAIAATESGLNRKITELQHAYGESWEQVLRLCAAVSGDKTGAADMEAKVMWRDTSAKSLAQAVDAWGKATQMLGIAPQVLWRKIPGITEADIEDAEKLAKTDPLTRISEQLAGETLSLTEGPEDAVG